ncbi:MAG: M28 family peptidase [Clostridiales bacterium]|nr:M28 family peptidase [Clostridiales bacterium]
MEILNELLEKYQVRRTKAQKTAFLEFAQEACAKRGYEARIEEYKGSRKSRNLVAGDPEKALVIFTAHYDTCAEMPVPNLIFPKNMPLTFLVQMPLVLVMLALGLGTGLLLWHVTGNELMYSLGFLTVYFGLFALIFFGPANRHTANDNTSGTASLFRIMEMLPEDQRKKAAFIFFDNEEFGKIGSQQYAKAHPDIKKNALIVNLDCIGDGQHFLIVAPKKKDEALEKLLLDSFQDQGEHKAIHCSAKNTHYNSDQLAFTKGTAIAACRKNKLGYHVPRIHTRRDVICEESNLEYVCQGAVKMVDFLEVSWGNRK